jgi:hypothetical protein
MAVHTELSPAEAADRLALRELFDAYAHCADRRDAEGQNRYEVTTHFNGQSTVTLDGDRATGESYTIAHHVYTEDGDRKSTSPSSSTTSSPSPAQPSSWAYPRLPPPPTAKACGDRPFPS